MDPAHPIPDPRDLLSHSAWLRQLVAPLLGGDAAIDDVLQETWLAALERPPQDAHRLRGWLGRVAWRSANRDRRAARRRAAREARAARPELVPAAHRVAAEVELQGQLAAHVLALEPHYRDAILLRFYDGLPPRAIAQELNAPVATVKTWIRRGIEKLRERLAGELGPEWRGALAPLALTSTIAAPASSAIATASTGSLLAIAMNVKLLTGLAALSVLGALLWFAQTDVVTPSDRAPSEVSASTAALARTERSASDSATVASTPNVRRGETAENAGATPAVTLPREFLVEVLDSDGTPRRDVEVGLSIGPRDASGRSQRTGVGPHHRVHPKDSEPRIRIPASEIERAFAEAEARFGASAASARVEVAIDCMLRGIDCERQVLTSAIPPEEPIRLRIGAVGTVIVDVLDVAGTALSTLVQVQLRISPRPGEEGQALDPRLKLGKAAEKGRASFRFVPVGRTVEALIWDHSPAPLAVEPVRAAGPERAGDEVRITLHVVGETTRLIGRLVDDRDVPHAERRVRFAAFEGPQEVSVGLETDAEGRFETRWLSTALRDLRPDRFEISLLDERGRPAPSATGRVIAPPLPATGTVDLGTIAIAMPRLLAAGVVVDENGEPLANASISLLSVWPVPPRGDSEEYRSLHDAKAITDDEGHFEIHSAEKVRALHVMASARSYFESEPTYAEPGRTDLRLVLHRGLALEGSVLLDEGVPPHAILALFLGSSSKQRGVARVGADRRFSFTNLPPVSGSVVLHLHGTVPLLRVDGIELGRGSERAPERIRDLDLRGKIRAIAVRCVEADDVPIAHANFALADPTAPPHRFDAQLDAEGRARLWLPSSWESFWLVAEGHAPVSVVWSGEERLVRLGAGFPIALELEGDLALRDGFALSVAVGIPKSSPLSVIEKAAVPQLPRAIAPERPVKLRLPLAGNYELVWTLRSTISERELRFATTPLHVPSASAEQTLRVAPPVEALERALATLR